MARPSPAGRKYLRRFAPAMLFYVLCVVVVARFVHGAHPPTGWRLYAAAVLPALPLLAVIWAMGRYVVEETDEYQRMLQVQTYLWAAGITLALSTVWGFIEDLAQGPHVPAYWAFIVFCGAMGGVQIVRRLFERGEGA